MVLQVNSPMGNGVARAPRAAGPLKVLVASWAPFCAGAEVAALRLAMGLREAGHCVTVVLGTDGETLARMRAAGIDVRLVPLAFTDRRKWLRYHLSQRQLRRVLLDVQPDVVHANDLPTSQMVGRAVAKAGIPRVCHHRWIFGGEAIGWLNKFGAERHIFVSRALLDELCNVSPQLARVPCKVIHDGLPLPDVESESQRLEARRILGLPVDKCVVLFAGQTIERKGVADLLHAWRLLPERTTKRCELIFIGDDLERGGEYRRQMEGLAKSLGSPARFMGMQQNVPSWLMAADVCVVPSHAEPLGNATLEAMAHGRPVVGANVGGIPEMILDGVTGLLVPPCDPQQLANAIDRLVTDVDLGKSMGRAARRRCEVEFSLGAHVDAIVGEYREVLVRHRGAVA